jgi:hypothetical protein
VKEMDYTELGPDASATWWLLLADNPKESRNETLLENEVPWQDEVEFKKQYFLNKFKYKSSMREFRLYELEMALGESTLCSRKGSCNYFILMSDTDPNIFITIVKF